MTYAFTSFLSLRDLIIQNSILNKILIAYLTDAKDPIVLGKALIRLEGKLRCQVRKEKGAEPPNYIMADVVICFDLDCKVGYSYEHYPIIWTNQRKKPDYGNVTQMKELTIFIINSYSFNASHTDKIFSKLPKSLSNLLEINKISPNYWKTGFSKSIPKGSEKTVIKSELADYYSLLYRRLSDWRIFNKILIAITKKNFVEIASPNFGLLRISPYFDKTRLRFSFTSLIDNIISSESVNYSDLTPEHYEALKGKIDIFTLRHFFSLG